MSLATLCAEINAKMGDSCLTNANTPEILELLSEYQSNPKDWLQYHNQQPGTYTRNLVDDGNGKYNLMVLCWAPGCSSPVHDHSNSHCLVKVLQGTLTETLYDWPCQGTSGNSSTTETGLTVKKMTEFQENQVSYMHDTIGLHKISNPTPEYSVSLHLYSPPFQYCKTFCEKTGSARQSGKCVFFSVKGEKVGICEKLISKYRACKVSIVQNSDETLGQELQEKEDSHTVGNQSTERLVPDLTLIRNESKKSLTLSY